MSKKIQFGSIVGAAVMVSAMSAVVHAEVNPFVSQDVTASMQLAANTEGKCGAAHGAETKGDKEGKCGAEAKGDHEGKCGAEAKGDHEGKCGASPAPNEDTAHGEKGE